MAKNCHFLKKKKIILVVSLWFFLGIATYANDAQRVNFSEAVQLALSSNPKIVASKADIAAASAEVTETRGNGLPNLNIEMNAARSDNPLNVFSYKLSQGQASFADFGFAQYTGPGSINTKPTALDSPGYYNNVDTGIVVNIPLFSGGETIEKVKKTKYLLKAAREGNQAAKSALIYAVLQSYEGVHATTQIIRAAKQSCMAAKAYLKLTNDLYAQSAVIKGDVLFAKSNLRIAKTALKTAIEQRKNALDAFRIIIGKPESHLLPGKTARLLSTNEKTNNLLKQAFLSNPALLSLEFKVSADKADIGAAKANNLPKINLQLRHDWNADSFSISNPSNTAMLALNWKLFSSGAQSGADKKAVAQYDQSSAALSDAFNNIRLSVIQAVRAVKVTQMQLESSKRTVIASREIVKSYQRRYGQGFFTLGQLLDAQSRLDNARVQTIMNRYHLMLDQARLLILIHAANHWNG
ncbi:MAG: TolC family protein [Gammaproteobacteria bacterium CG_4_10_14_0_8_um_filter_38_16]|nr:MAG: TolC family protein [Gammaproteobacteria bacterium CG_4_10_14_0_8_um_filter_38_16]PJA02833.1 MAG: TolC family protein [Gammaproteobacteria bacterium CG_4_10_14_0_2_um_filter_38_22]PJB10698.1 MAG: TolC family protein [Gammaproteobacteria bacterium CG_4_9_14_3_um_filter_38_9]